MFNWTLASFSNYSLASLESIFLKYASMAVNVCIIYRNMIITKSFGESFNEATAGKDKKR